MVDEIGVCADYQVGHFHLGINHHNLRKRGCLIPFAGGAVDIQDGCGYSNTFFFFFFFFFFFLFLFLFFFFFGLIAEISIAAPNSGPVHSFEVAIAIRKTNYPVSIGNV